MDREGLREHDDATAGVEEFVIGQPRVLDHRAEGGELTGGALDGVGDIRRQAGETLVEMPDDAHAQALDAARQRTPEIGLRHIGAGRIERVITDDNVHRDRRVLDAPRERAAMIERIGERKHAAPRHQPIGRLEADRAAIGGGPADRAARVRAHRHAHEARRDRGARTGRGAAGNMIGIPRIARGRKRQVEARPAQREFMRGELAQKRAAGRPEPRRDDRILGGNVVFAQLRMTGGANARRVENIL